MTAWEVITTTFLSLVIIAASLLIYLVIFGGAFWLCYQILKWMRRYFGDS